MAAVALPPAPSGLEWAVLRAADPRAYLSRFTSQRVRPDGRGFLSRRARTVQRGNIANRYVQHRESSSFVNMSTSCC